MPTGENKEIVRVLVEQIINKRNIERVDELFAPNYIFHIPGFPTMDKQGLKKFIARAKCLSLPFLTSMRVSKTIEKYLKSKEQ